MEKLYVGQPVKRREDDRLLRGRGQFLADLQVPGELYAVFVRSIKAHARVTAVDVSRALQTPGVVTCFTGGDLQRRLGFLPLMQEVHPVIAATFKPVVKPRDQPVMAWERVLFVGEAIAVVVATSLQSAEDAADAVRVEHEDFPVVAEVSQALSNSTLLHPEWGSNVSVAYRMQVGDLKRAAAEAEVKLRQRFHCQRVSANSLETRGVAAEWDERQGRLVCWSSTQVPHLVREEIARATGLSELQVRVIAPDMGGGFGCKTPVYPEEFVIAYLAVALRRRVKWVEDRREYFVATAHASDQYHDVEVYALSDGTLLGLKDSIVLDAGAYNPWGINTTFNTVAHLPGPYKLRNYDADVRVIVTNKTPSAPYRGAGRPEATFVMDRVLDLLAVELNVDPLEIRLRNMVQHADIPYATGRLYKDGVEMIYESGDFPRCLREAAAAVNYQEVRQRQASLRAKGRYLGVGFGTYIEGTGQGPSEGARVRIDGGGRIFCFVTAPSQGQGHETTWAQIAADVLGVPIDDVHVSIGDSDHVSFGRGVYSSRGTVLIGNSVYRAAAKVRDLAFRLAAQKLEVSVDDLEVRHGRVQVKGTPHRHITFGRLAEVARPDCTPPVAGLETGLQAEAYFLPETCAYANGVHCAVVEVDIESGQVTVLDYAVVHDCGRIVNPMIVEGQVRGGVVQGLGMALYEEVTFDSAAQMTSGTYMDYLLPTAVEVPPIRVYHLESPSPRNPLGIKGIGEAGVIAVPAAIANAVEDALRPFGALVVDTPLHPEKVLDFMHKRHAAQS